MKKKNLKWERYVFILDIIVLKPIFKELWLFDKGRSTITNAKGQFTRYDLCRTIFIVRT